MFTTGRKKGMRIILSAVFLAGVYLAVQMPQPCEGKDEAVEKVLISLEVRNEALRSVLEKISKATGYQITVTERWAKKPVTAKIENQGLEKALKKIIEAVGKPSHVIVMNETKKRIEVLICDSIGEEQVSASASGKKADLWTRVVTPPAGPRGSGLTEARLKVIQEAVKQYTLPKDTVVIPPGGSGDRGLTIGQIEKIQERAKQYTLPKDTVVIPPGSLGSRGLTLGELELLTKIKESGETRE